jgi:enamine deaminase RidA (YjgF/YER057c/UK114 family)
MTITRLETGRRMSGAVIHNGLVWLSGQVAEDGGDVYAQTRQCLAEVDRLLAAAGTDKTRILQAQVWLADAGTVAEMNRAWEEWVPQGHTPARATGESKLVAPQYLVEVIVVAALP